jgi:alpha-tubulin suppressor-like RCC1 family protein
MRRSLCAAGRSAWSAAAARDASSLTLFTWGGGTGGALGHGTLDNEPVPRPVEDGPLSEALKRDGAATVSCGLFHTAVVTASGQAFIFGRGLGGRLAQGDEETAARPIALALPAADDGRERRVAAVALGGLHTAVLSRDGELYTAGWGGWGGA